MKRLLTLGIAAILSLSRVGAGQYFYQTDFDGPLNQVGQLPTTDFGNSNQTAFVSGSPLIVASFDQITNQALLLKGSDTNYQFDGMGFFLSRGASNYFIDFDFETHNLSTSGLHFDIAFLNAQFQLYGTGNLQVFAQYSQTYQIGWTDDQVHHVHAQLNENNATWSFQLDNTPAVGGQFATSGDEFQVGFQFMGADFPGDPTVQIAIDNLRIGTTDNLPPLTTVHWFKGLEGTQPHCKLVQGKDGAFYGTTEAGPVYTNGQSFGTVFKIKSDGNTDWIFPFDGTNGSTSAAGLVLGSDGYLYGTTSQGGDYNKGTAFKMSTSGNLIWSVSFNGSNGSAPSKELVQVGRSFYGTTPTGGTQDMGTVFSLTRDGTIASVYSFTGGLDGGKPLCCLLPGENGNLYGTTSAGGEWPNAGHPWAAGGTVFSLKRNGKLSTLFSFDGTNGYSPMAGLTKGSSDTFYGTAAGGGAFDHGTMFRITSGGKFKLLYSFAAQSVFPETELVRGQDGNFYGTTLTGGGSIPLGSFGTIFRITPKGEFTRLAAFHGGDGSFPDSGLIIGKDGRLYGTTWGGAFSTGNLFYVPICKPVQVITSPPSGAVFFRPDIQLSGRTKADPPITNVFYQVNGGPWNQATTKNAWANWTALATLKPGQNTIRAYAVNGYGATSRTNAVGCQLVPRTDTNHR
jgi:uncharacterized repeat protein (TIGR03803 family)